MRTKVKEGGGPFSLKYFLFTIVLLLSLIYIYPKVVLKLERYNSAKTTDIDCSYKSILCVDDTAGANQEFSTIQTAVDEVSAGGTIVVFQGLYESFTVTECGFEKESIKIVANGEVLIEKYGSNGNGITLKNVNNIIVDGFIVKDAPNHCIEALGATPENPMSGNQLINITCSDSEYAGFYLSDFSNGVIENNKIVRAGHGLDGKIYHGLELLNSGSDGNNIRNNIIDSAGSSALYIVTNFSKGGDGQISDLLIEKNTLFGSGINGINMDGVVNSVISNNLLYDNNRHGLRIYQIDAVQGLRNMRIVNNTIDSSQGVWAIKNTTFDGGYEIFNNILLGGTGSILVLNSNMSSDNNIVTDFFSTKDKTTIISFEGWQGFGFDSHSFVANGTQLFVDVENNNYKLASTSVAIDNGVLYSGNKLSEQTDINGSKRLIGEDIDIGAVEYE